MKEWITKLNVLPTALKAVGKRRDESLLEKRAPRFKDEKKQKGQQDRQVRLHI